MTADEIVRALMAQGVPGERAERFAASAIETRSGARAGAVEPPAPLVVHPAAVRLTLPWSALCPDNERESAGLTMRGGKPLPRKVMTARYREARNKIIGVARELMRTENAAPFDVPLSLVAHVFTPTQRRVDVANFAKGVHDALNKIVYTDDNWLYDVRWVRCGMDMDRPRVELEISPL